MIKIVLKSGNLLENCTAEEFADWVNYVTLRMARKFPDVPVTAIPYGGQQYVGHEVQETREGGEEAEDGVYIPPSEEWHTVFHALNGVFYDWLLRRLPPAS